MKTKSMPMPWPTRFEWFCLFLAFFASGVSVRGCVEVTEPVQKHYLAGGADGSI
jgi:hypothetical protein